MKAKDIAKGLFLSWASVFENHLCHLLYNLNQAYLDTTNTVQ